MFTEVDQHSSKDPRDIRLAEPRTLCHLGLRATLEESQLDHETFALVEMLEEPGEKQLVVNVDETKLNGSEDPIGPGCRDLIAVNGGLIDAGHPIRRANLERLDHVVDRFSEFVGEFCDGGRAAESIREHAFGVAHREGKILCASRGTDGPRLVPEVPLQLAFDGSTRERRELHTASGIESVDCPQDRQPADLTEVLGINPTPCTLPDVVLDDAVVKPDNLVPASSVTRRLVLREQGQHGGPTPNERRILCGRTSMTGQNVG